MSLQRLAPKDDTQRSLKAEGTSLSVDLAKIRTLLAAQSVFSISKLMLAILIRG